MKRWNPETTDLLSFSPMRDNAKLSQLIARGRERGFTGRYLSLSLPAAWSCPNARDCKAHADEVTGAITDGPHVQYRCYAASMEAWNPSLRAGRWQNYRRLLQATTPQAIAELIRRSLIDAEGWDNRSVIRIHDSGDFYNPVYFRGWMAAASSSPLTHYYAYTKALPYWIRYRAEVPNNVELIASAGGTHDRLIAEHNLRQAIVVYSDAEADERGLLIDHDDELAAFGERSFALLIHGTQPIGSRASKAVSAIRRAQRERVLLPMIAAD